MHIEGAEPQWIGPVNERLFTCADSSLRTAFALVLSDSASASLHVTEALLTA